MVYRENEIIKKFISVKYTFEVLKHGTLCKMCKWLYFNRLNVYFVT